MARPIRIAIYHITSRGNAGQAIFEHFSDKKQFLSILGQVVDRHRWLCYACCLMDNHYHLLIESLEPNLSLGIPISKFGLFIDSSKLKPVFSKFKAILKNP